MRTIWIIFMSIFFISNDPPVFEESTTCNDNKGLYTCQDNKGLYASPDNQGLYAPEGPVMFYKNSKNL